MCVIAQEIITKYFPDDNYAKAAERIRSHLRRTEDGKKRSKERLDRFKSSHEIKADGTQIKNELIEVRQGEDMTPEYLLLAHGFEPSEWEVVSCINNFWGAQKKGGEDLMLYQSKLTVKPKMDKLTLADVDAYFENKTFSELKPPIQPLQYDENGEVLEVCIPDLHSGLLAWRMETGKDYDVHIAQANFSRGMQDIKERCKGKKFSKILFVTLGDLLHIDNEEQRTTKGTLQQADGRLPKIYDATTDMLIDGISMAGEIAPVEVVYLPGNHDRTTGYFLIKTVEKAFLHDSNVTFDTRPNSLKFRKVGVNLIGWTHGDMPQKNMSSWLQQHARKEFGDTKFAEVHAGHFHSQKEKAYRYEEVNETIEEKGVKVRYMPSLCEASYWEHQQAYAISVKTMVSYVWHKEHGLRGMWFSNI